MTEQEPRSGLSNPQAAVRGVGAGALGAEGLVLLLAIVPLNVVGAHLTGFAIATVIALACVCFGLAGLLRRRWAWPAASVLQVVLVGSGLVFHWYSPRSASSSDLSGCMCCTCDAPFFGRSVTARKLLVRGYRPSRSRHWVSAIS